MVRCDDFFDIAAAFILGVGWVKVAVEDSPNISFKTFSKGSPFFVTESTKPGKPRSFDPFDVSTAP
ncbi:MAG: hypothetical protein EBZ48_03945 [Proteobacteria bacterium]|nr:hypothetical protein [Pseudomonadota bacterium]